jgi:2-polyprenyl-3-methyl-5-hydroxy-6-metoxy-1,4-benzoquinol methylase
MERDGEQVDFSRAPRVRDRLQWLRPHVARGPVLDLGCIDERHPERIASSLHAELKRINPAVVGADVDRAAIEAVARLGFDVRWADAQSSELGGPYAAIVAAELIEHLDDPGAFLANARRALAPGGRLLLTTPNPFYANQFAKIAKYGAPQVHERHRAWFDPRTLSVLLAAKDFAIEDFAWLAPSSGLLRRALASWRPYWCPGFAVAAAPR